MYRTDTTALLAGIDDDGGDHDDNDGNELQPIRADSLLTSAASTDAIVVCSRYTALTGMTMSDHRPLVGEFSVRAAKRAGEELVKVSYLLVFF